MNAPTRPETILVAEDEDVIREIVRLTLEDAGFRVLAANDGLGAVAIAQDHDGPVDLLLTDVVMPLVNGAAAAIAVESVRPGTPVLFMTGYTDDVLVRHGVASGAARVLRKPFTPAELVARVREVLGREG